MKKTLYLILSLLLLLFIPIVYAGPFGIIDSGSTDSDDNGQVEDDTITVDEDYFCVTDEDFAYVSVGDCMTKDEYDYYYNSFFPPIEEMTFNQAILEKASGYYDLSYTFDNGWDPVTDVKSLLYIPKGLDANIPSALMVYYHGMTDDPEYYRNMGSLKSWADQYKFMALSVQNYWSLNYYTQYTDQIVSQTTGSEMSINAAINEANTLLNMGVLDRDLIFVTGFSAGGIPAQSAMAGYPYFFRGLGNFSGNFYEYDVGYFADNYETMAMLVPDLLDAQKNYQYDDALILASYGGDSEADRVKTQMPESIDFWTNLGAYVNYYEHSGGHAMTSSAFAKFMEVSVWPAMEEVKLRDKALFFEKDIYNSIYKEAILTLKNEGIISGYDDGSFHSWKKINRAEFTKLTMEAKGFISGPRNCFPDVTTQWFASYVCQAQLEGVIAGYDDGNFHPDGEINVVEALKIILEAFEVPVRDLEEGDNWYQPYLDYAEQNGLYLDTFVSIDEKISREDMAELIYRIRP